MRSWWYFCFTYEASCTCVGLIYIMPYARAYAGRYEDPYSPGGGAKYQQSAPYFGRAGQPPPSPIHPPGHPLYNPPDPHRHERPYGGGGGGGQNHVYQAYRVEAPPAPSTGYDKRSILDPKVSRLTP